MTVLQQVKVAFRGVFFFSLKWCSSHAEGALNCKLLASNLYGNFALALENKRITLALEDTF